MTTIKRAVSSAAEKLPTPLPRWDMNPIFPGLQSPEFEGGFSRVVAAIDGLTQLFDRHNVRLLMSEERTPVTGNTILAFEEVIHKFNAVLEEYRTLSAYIQCIFSTDTRDSVALNRFSE